MIRRRKKLLSSALNWTREGLESQSDQALQSILSELEEYTDQLAEQEASNQILHSIIRRRSGRVLLGSVLSVKLNSRIERLFEAVRPGNNDSWPINEVMEVLDGLISRMLAKRLVIVLVAIITVIPAVGSLILLAKQNQVEIERAQYEEAFEYLRLRSYLLEIINGTESEYAETDGQESWVKVPTYHQRLREEAFGTFISVDKLRWTRKEFEAYPPIRFVNLKGCNLEGLLLGAGLGLLENQNRSDLTRVYLAGANLTNTEFTQSSLSGSVFKDARAENLYITCPKANHCDFTGIQAPNAYFAGDGITDFHLELRWSDFSNADLTRSNWEGVAMYQSRFHNTNLSGATFSYSMIVDCDFSSAKMGAGVSFLTTHLNNCLMHVDQKEKAMFQEEYTYFETTEDPNILRIMADQVRYQSWLNNEMLELEPAVEQEAKELEARSKQIEDAEF